MPTPDPSQPFDFYGLPILDRWTVDYPIPHLLVKVNGRDKCPKCPFCGSENVNYHMKKTLTLRDAPFQGRRVTVSVEMSGNQCGKCGRKFMPPRAFQDGRQYRTPRLREWILDHAQEKTHTLVSMTGLGWSTVNGILKQGQQSPASPA